MLYFYELLDQVYFLVDYASLQNNNVIMRVSFLDKLFSLNHSNLSKWYIFYVSLTSGFGKTHHSPMNPSLPKKYFTSLFFSNLSLRITSKLSVSTRSRWEAKGSITYAESPPLAPKMRIFAWLPWCTDEARQLEMLILTLGSICC